MLYGIEKLCRNILTNPWTNISRRASLVYSICMAPNNPPACYICCVQHGNPNAMHLVHSNFTSIDLYSNYLPVCVGYSSHQANVLWLQCEHALAHMTWVVSHSGCMSNRHWSCWCKLTSEHWSVCVCVCVCGHNAWQKHTLHIDCSVNI